MENEKPARRLKDLAGAESCQLFSRSDRDITGSDISQSCLFRAVPGEARLRDKKCYMNSNS
ncbi:MAG: hypothetical protein A3G49_06385 [Candidatus Sungbacteria bacterium RIFCSPLOWO2_12_FULL_41_11]|uniref:Uncharacterized protein n=1 Tax=Candidatus Sungbacteria bacterium RIFCSPLOWO2_12_FULL_41_11 TaxID=1802286 RepID=A0A1G2LS20_9BACT|nr:MAG: hypothetical protein UV01_C0003G0055 [Parcubacteria group bacterium GW2011_GWA2_42_14]OHA14448.1 MAG: hypothetical protein A3G49_06385 [Candidatus Sungbacteria bacterium RIFCSPLOWO2_12_FULL_41_11]